MSPILEKRRFPRILISSVTVEVYSFLGDAVPSETCSIIDISENGLRFATQKTYTDSQVLRLTFILPHVKTPIQANALVIHKYFQDEHFHIGTQFVNVDDQDLNLLRGFLKKYLPSSKKDL
jgi:hypothetical protein